MSPRTGRPTDNPKILSTRVRLSQEDTEKLEWCSKKLGLPKSEVLRLGIRKVYKELKN